MDDDCSDELAACDCEVQMRVLRSLLLAALALPLVAQGVVPPHVSPSAVRAADVAYVPAKGEWQTRKPSELGMDDALLAAAVAWAKQQETDMPRDFSTQAEIFGTPLGPVPSTRALTNGLILRHGYIIAEWGDTNAVDPTYSIAKSYLSTILGLTVDRGLIGGVTERVGATVHDGGYDSAHNSKVTWEHHVTQTSEWDGELFGKTSTFIGKEAFGTAARKPRELKEPGQLYEYNDVRVNRFALSMLRVWKRPLPEVLKTEIMDPIRASDTWVYHAYDNATVEVDGKPMKSISGGTRWGAGLWISTRDHARFGLMISRKGMWGEKRIISEEWIDAATRQQGKSDGYGYLWWLNSSGAWPDAPRSSFAAIGAGSNTIWIDPEHDIVVVWRWHKGGNVLNELFKRVTAAVKSDE